MKLKNKWRSKTKYRPSLPYYECFKDSKAVFFFLYHDRLLISILLQMNNIQEEKKTRTRIMVISSHKTQWFWRLPNFSLSSISPFYGSTPATSICKSSQQKKNLKNPFSFLSRPSPMKFQDILAPSLRDLYLQKTK